MDKDKLKARRRYKIKIREQKEKEAVNRAIDVVIEKNLEAFRELERY